MPLRLSGIGPLLNPAGRWAGHAAAPAERVRRPRVVLHGRSAAHGTELIEQALDLLPALPPDAESLAGADDRFDLALDVERLRFATSRQNIACHLASRGTASAQPWSRSSKYLGISSRDWNAAYSASASSSAGVGFALAYGMCATASWIGRSSLRCASRMRDWPLSRRARQAAG